MHKIISRPDIMDCLIEISDFQGGCILLKKKDNETIVGEYYRCVQCSEWVEVDGAYRDWRFNPIFCSKDCFAEFLDEIFPLTGFGIF